MAITVTKKMATGDGGIHPRQGYGDHRDHGIELKGTITFDNSYPTDGETLDLSDVFPVAVTWVSVFPLNGDAYAVYVAGTGPSDGKVKVFVASTGVEVANGSSALDGLVANFIACGIA